MPVLSRLNFYDFLTFHLQSNNAKCHQNQSHKMKKVNLLQLLEANTKKAYFCHHIKLQRG